MILMLGMTYALPQGNAQGNEKVRVIIGLKGNNGSDVVKAVNGKVLKNYKKVNLVTASIPAHKVDALKKNKNVQFIEEDIKVQTSAQTQDWGISKVSAPTAWSNGYTGEGVKVGVIDTGIAKHEDFVIAGGVSTVGYTTSFIDDDGHGTHVAGIISADNNTLGTVGIAPNSEIYAIKALDNNGSGYLSDIIAGVDWAIENARPVLIDLLTL